MRLYTILINNKYLLILHKYIRTKTITIKYDIIDYVGMIRTFINEYQKFITYH